MRYDFRAGNILYYKGGGTEMRKMRLDRKSKAKVMAQLKELTLKMKKENKE